MRMAAITHMSQTYQAPRARWVLWAAIAGSLAALLGLLSVSVIEDRNLALDTAVMDWVLGWELPGLGGIFRVVSLVTSSKAGLIYGPAGIAALLLLGKRRAAVTFAALGGVVGVAAVLGDYTLGEIIGRTRPLADSTVPSFPSGHVFGSTVFFGFSAYLAVYYGL